MPSLRLNLSFHAFLQLPLELGARSCVVLGSAARILGGDVIDETWILQNIVGCPCRNGGIADIRYLEDGSKP